MAGAGAAPDDHDLDLPAGRYADPRRFAPAFLDALASRSAGDSALPRAVDRPRRPNGERRRVPPDAATLDLVPQWRERVYLPWITLSLSLSQVLSPDHSCDEAVDRSQKFRHDRVLPPVSPETTSYCEARARLPEGLSWELVRRTGRTIEDRADRSCLFHGRPVKILDGSTVVMPDPPRNRWAYPSPAGLGYAGGGARLRAVADQLDDALVCLDLLREEIVPPSAEGSPSARAPRGEPARSAGPGHPRG